MPWPPVKNTINSLAHVTELNNFGLNALTWNLPHPLEYRGYKNADDFSTGYVRAGNIVLMAYYKSYTGFIRHYIYT